MARGPNRHTHTRVTLNVGPIDFSQVSEASIVAALTPRVVNGFKDLAAEVVDVARARAPKSDGDEGSTRFTSIKLRSVNQFGEKDFETRNRRAEVEALLAEARGGARLDVLNSNDVRFFQGTDPNTGQRNKTPDVIDIRGNKLVGGFKHVPGTLKASIKFDGVLVEGNTIRATVRAHAPYAYYVHEGFKHKGGWKVKAKKGGTRIKGQKFLLSALVNIRTRLTDTSTYRG